MPTKTKKAKRTALTAQDKKIRKNAEDIRRLVGSVGFLLDSVERVNKSLDLHDEVVKKLMGIIVGLCERLWKVELHLRHEMEPTSKLPNNKPSEKPRPPGLTS